MKKTLPVAAVMTALVAAPTLTSCGQADLSIFNWGEYISMDVLHDFEDKYGVRVKLRTFDSNELMLNKLENSSFDVIFPSDYAIEEMVAKDMIQPIDWTKLKFKPETDMVPSLYNSLKGLAADQGTQKGFDLLKYAVPYTWGEIGILYNTQKISKSEIERDGWEALRNPTNSDGSKRKCVVYDAARDLYSMALIANGKSIVDVSAEDIALASDWLRVQKEAFGNNIAYKTEEILDDMTALKYDICFTYAGDAIYSIDNVVNPANGEKDPSLLEFYIPEAVDGGTTRTNIYCDAMVISKECENLDLAHKFIDFMSGHDAAYENTLEIGYTTPRNDVYEEITAEYSAYEKGEGSFYKVREAYRVQAKSNDVFYRYDDKLKKTLEDEWIKVKNSRG